MSFFDKLGEFLYSNTSSELEDNAALHEEVARGQKAQLDRRYDEGKVGWLDYFGRRGEIADAGSMTRDYQEKTGSPWHVILGIPWYVWVVVLCAAFWYLGGFLWLKGILAKNK